MGKKIKQVEVWVCDRCGKESGLRYTCIVCGKELCNKCAKYYGVSVEEFDIHYSPGIFVPKLHHKGVHGYWCIEHGEELKQKLRGLGFKDFEYTVNPV